MAGTKDVKNKELKSFERFFKASLDNEQRIQGLGFDKVVSESENKVLKRIIGVKHTNNNKWANFKDLLLNTFSRPALALMFILICIVLTTLSVTGLVLYQRNAPERHIDQTIKDLDQNLLELQSDENLLLQSDQDLSNLDQTI